MEDRCLHDLPNIISICPNNFYATWPSLKSFVLRECPLLIIASVRDFMAHYFTRKLSFSRTIKDLKMIVKHLGALEKLIVKEQSKIEGIFHLKGLPMNGQYVTSKLSYLELFNLLELRHIFMGPTCFLSLQYLQNIIITRCGKLKTIFSTSILRSLPQLAYLNIEDCEELEQIIEDNENQNLSDPQCQSWCIPELIAMIVTNCPKLKRLCRSHNFPKLELLSIREASELEEVFGCEQYELMEPQVPVLPKLNYLILMELSRIAHFYQGIDVPYCVVLHCPKLNLPSTIVLEDLQGHHLDIELEELHYLEILDLQT